MKRAQPTLVVAIVPNFAAFNLTKPSLARLVSVEDKIHLEIEFRTSRRGQ